jgi:hypothetical protein
MDSADSDALASIVLFLPAWQGFRALQSLTNVAVFHLPEIAFDSGHSWQVALRWGSPVTGVSRQDADAQRCGNSSSMRKFGCVGKRVSTSLR